MPVVVCHPRHSESSCLPSVEFVEINREMSQQHYTKSSYYANNKLAASQTGGIAMSGMGNHHAFPHHQTVSDAFRYPTNVHHHHHQQQQQQDYVKPANPPLKMLVPSDMVGAIIGV